MPYWMWTTRVAFLQFGEVNVERGAGGQRVRGFQPARPLDFVAAKNFRVGDDDEFCLFANEAAGKRAEVSPQSKVHKSRFCARLWTVDH